MNIKNLLWALCLTTFSLVSVGAQSSDSLLNIRLHEVAVTASHGPKPVNTTLTALNVNTNDIRMQMGSSIVDALAHTEGVQAMDIGVGFSKPMIRGLGFQRIAVTENGVKQEGQQWGADHGLEMDAFHVEDVRIIKGPASVLYGSDAMAGVLEILPPAIPKSDTIMGEAVLQNQSASTGLSGSMMLSLKRGNQYLRFRYTERHWADYHVPADSFTYLSMRLAINHRRLKNTAGMERSVNTLWAFRHNDYKGRIALSDSYQKSGFFSGAHGIPDSKNLTDDNSRWNIDMPYSLVNHFKATSVNQFTNGMAQTTLTLGYQLNHREEWSLFHTHNVNQKPPEREPNKELSFHLHTATALLHTRLTPSTTWEHHWGLSEEYQNNTIGGYSFLIPEYVRNQSGLFYLANCRPTSRLTLNASGRIDMGYIHTYAYQEQAPEVVKHLCDYSFAIGAEYSPNMMHQVKVSVGRAFRMPSPNELTSNGVHHGAFRHEKGDCTLNGENGWQADISYMLHLKRVELDISPFMSYYAHYITLQPTGQWSELPDAGQIYKYIDSPALLSGGETKVTLMLWGGLTYSLSGEYVYTSDRKAHTALPFSPPATMRNMISLDGHGWQIFAELQSVSAQNRVCHNEDKTPAYNLLHAGGSVDIPLRCGKATLSVCGNNLLNTSYLNHLSFYRKIELPEKGIDIQTTIKVTF